MFEKNDNEFRQLMLCFTATVKPCYTSNGNQTNVPGIEDQAGGAGLPFLFLLMKEDHMNTEKDTEQGNQARGAYCFDLSPWAPTMGRTTRTTFFLFLCYRALKY
ncbi:hypothetical protein NC651_032009 [Populus alba x Populus x berolinensis]|nr:hypothetical protein NC651_032009 [Populus alba x Populus x berolinensis]